MATNYAASLGAEEVVEFPSHTEVKENAARVEENFGKLVDAILRGHRGNREKG